MSIHRNITVMTLAVQCCLSASAASAGTFTNVYSFTGLADSAIPCGGLTLFQGALYGTMKGDVSKTGDFGGVFQYNPTSGVLKVLYRFKGQGGSANPCGSLSFSGHTLYGMTDFGKLSFGDIYSIDLSTGKELSLFNFAGGAYGEDPLGNLLQIGGYFYGVTKHGGVGDSGTIFRFDPASKSVKILYKFKGGTDGAIPFDGLVQQNNVLYGTTGAGGNHDNGTAFSFNLATGAETILHRFAGFPTEGANPYASLLIAHGYLYGTTFFGGPDAYGTVFKMDLSGGNFHTLYSWGGVGQYGAYPASRLTLANGYFYSTTTVSLNGDGTIFQTSASGATNLLFTFPFATDDQYGETAGPLVYLNGALYGVSSAGGTAGKGAIYKFVP